MPVISGKRAFLEILKQEGVEVVFGNPGTTELALMDAFAVENDIRYVLGLQEAVVMAMADGYLRSRYLCSPVSTSSLFWLWMVDAITTMPVVRCGISAVMVCAG